MYTFLWKERFGAKVCQLYLRNDLYPSLPISNENDSVISPSHSNTSRVL